MYATAEQLRDDAQSKSCAMQDDELTDRHQHNRRGSWQDLAAQAAAHGIRFDGLPERQAQALRLKLAGATAREIGEALGVSKRAVRRLLQRARGNLNT
jgi:DNA-directed RNA polymerase specialized sigma24 family protein